MLGFFSQHRLALHAKYEKLQDSEDDLPLREYSESKALPQDWKKTLFYPLLVLLILSNILTWASWWPKPATTSPEEGQSFYASLPRNVPTPLSASSEYTDKNEALRNQLWDAINIDAGMIAVPDSYVAEKGLPESQRFVWDESKSVYLLNGHHTLHCVRAVYISLMEFWQSKPQSRRWEHVIHCVDQLRQEALCNADDTPRFSTSDDVPVSGMGQVRMCRSWEKLETWARQYNACYRYVNQTASYREFPQIERFVWCPEGSPYKPKVEEVFGRIAW